jgi:hypothetical protein
MSYIFTPLEEQLGYSYFTKINQERSDQNWKSLSSFHKTIYIIKASLNVNYKINNNMNILFNKTKNSCLICNKMFLLEELDKINCCETCNLLLNNKLKSKL